jgi:uncharacterized membrane protein
VGTLERKGCVACHSTDGSKRVGPTFRGLYWSHRKVITDGTEREIVAKEEYVERSVRDPDADVVIGLPRGNMPRFDLSAADMEAVQHELKNMSEEVVPPKQPSMLPFATSVLWFVGMHFVLSSLPVRKRLIARFKERGFGALYSLVAAFGLIGIVWHFRSVPYIELFAPPRWTRWVPIFVMPVALLFMVLGFSTPGPTTVRQEERAKDASTVRGIQAVTRHPALWGFALWALSHLTTNGELHVVLLATGILVLAIGGMFHIDARRRHALGDAWTTYAEKTSILPFAAIARGTAKLRRRDIGLVRPIIVAVIYVGILHTHALVIGASPFP